MESDRFDALARSVASRRSLMARAGAGGLGAVLLGSLGRREEADAASACQLDTRVFVRVGPSAGGLILPTATQPGQLTGQLRLRVSSKGDLAGSTFALADGTSFPVAGSVSSHLIGARITLAPGQVVVLQGVADGGVTACQGALDGSVTGPHEGDLGDWHATAVPAAASSPTASAAAAAQSTTAAGGGQSGTGATTTDQPTATTDGGSTTDTPTPEPTESLTGACPDGQTECRQPTIGSSASHSCVDLTADANNCGACGNACASIEDRAVGQCDNGACVFSCLQGLVTCSPDAVCKTFLNKDNANCGACGNACGGDTPTCQNGVCVCDAQCTNGEQPGPNCQCVCKKLINSDPENCGACGNVCPAATPRCVRGECAQAL